MIGQFAFKFISIAIFCDNGCIYQLSGIKIIGIIFIIIYLGCFKPDIIHTDFLRQFFYIFYLVFIRFHHQKLEYDKWRFAFQFFFPFHNIFCSFNYFFQFSANPVLLVYFLRGAINGNDQTVQPAFNCSPCIFIS